MKNKKHCIRISIRTGSAWKLIVFQKHLHKYWWRPAFLCVPIAPPETSEFPVYRQRTDTDRFALCGRGQGSDGWCTGFHQSTFWVFVSVWSNQITYACWVLLYLRARDVRPPGAPPVDQYLSIGTTIIIDSYSLGQDQAANGCCWVLNQSTLWVIVTVWCVCYVCKPSVSVRACIIDTDALPGEASNDRYSKNMSFDPTYDVNSDLQISCCNIFGELKPGAIKRRFRVENRLISLADNRGSEMPSPLGGQGPGIPYRGAG